MLDSRFIADRVSAFFQVLLLMATAVSTSIPGGAVVAETQNIRDRQRRIAEITEMIHVSS